MKFHFGRKVFGQIFLCFRTFFLFSDMFLFPHVLLDTGTIFLTCTTSRGYFLSFPSLPSKRLPDFSDKFMYILLLWIKR
jgi:hypothetical protein